ncbi:MAG: hypothetical protein D6706_16930 [Chloroflexi bacterium]|nr:MAG: hypothetical protein D6706_16930 [Chloroflexota bacterium]
MAEIYLHVFQPVLYEVGCLWQINQITVAREHYCTAVTQFIMSQLYPYIFNTPRIGRTMVAACMGGELHEVGIRMVADFFEMAGWDTYYLGANVPPTDIVEIIATQNASILALSTTLMPHLHHVTQTIAAIRQHPHTQHVKILVGGYPFNLSPDLWQKVGADGYAPDAKTAVSQAATLIA